jgi:hypothetical protein
MEKTGVRACRAVAITLSMALAMVTSPPTQDLGAAAEHGLDRFRHPRRVFDLGLDQFEPEPRRGLLGLADEHAGVRLRRVPGDSDLGQARPHPLGDAEGVADRQHDALADHVRRPLERIGAVQPHVRDVRVGHDAEYVLRPAGLVGVGHDLHRRRAGGEYEIEAAVGDLAGDGVGGSQFVLGVVPRDDDRFAVAVALLGQGVEHAADAVVEHRRGRLLQDGDARQRRAVRPRRPHVAEQ